LGHQVAKFQKMLFRNYVKIPKKGTYQTTLTMRGEEALSPHLKTLTLYVHIVVIAGSTIGFFFSLTALLPIQYVSDGAQNNPDAADAHFGFCYAGFGIVHLEAQNVHNMGPSVSGHHPSYLRKRWIRQRADKEKKKQAILLYCLQ
jgi:hypothetical protein